jgi:hypothetical protein
MSKLEKLTIKFCEQLPLNGTIYEKEGFCQKPNDICEYCDKRREIYLCNKKTYTLKQVLI